MSKQVKVRMSQKEKNSNNSPFKNNNNKIMIKMLMKTLKVIKMRTLT